MKTDNALTRDIIQWDVKNWSQVLSYWEKEIKWEGIETCLELGARDGGLSLWLAMKENKTVVCSDYKDTKTSAEKLHERHKVNSKIKYQDIDATNIPYDNFFDLIVFKSIIGGIGRGNDIETQKKVFEQIYKALKPGGKLLFAENLIASPLHQFFRKKFNKWGSYWRYISVQETKDFLALFSAFELKTTGFLGAFGRTERQRSILARIDKIIFNNILPTKWKYIIYGIAEK